VAYNLVAITPNIFLSVVGTHGWFFASDVSESRGLDAMARCYTPLASGTSMLRVLLAYELWNTLAVLVIPEYKTAAFIGHHATTFYLAVIGLHPFLHYYTVFFVGPPSISSALLGLVDIWKHVPSLQRRLPTTNLVLRASFAVFFLITRTVMWPIISARFWLDTIHLLRTGSAHSTWAASFYLGANFFLTCLQILWASKIVQGLQKAIFGANDSGSDSKAS